MKVIGQREIEGMMFDRLQEVNECRAQYQKDNQLAATEEAARLAMRMWWSACADLVSGRDVTPEQAAAHITEWVMSFPPRRNDQ